MRHIKNALLAIGVALGMAIATAWAAGAVNINTASAKQLQKVHGFGAKTAEMIIAYRDEHGSFKSIEELTRVKGIGKKTLNKVRDEVTVGE